MVDVLNINLPQPGEQFVDEFGNIMRPWLYVLQSLQARTGGPAGISSTTIVEDITNISTPATITIMEDDDNASVAMPQIRHLNALSVFTDVSDAVASSPTQTITYPASFMVVGMPASSQTYNLTMVQTVTLPANFAGTQAYSNTSPTGH